MPTFYHGSAGLFTEPDFSLIKEGMGLGLNEYGWGVYAGTHGGDAWEYIHGRIASGKPAFIYRLEVDDNEFQNDFLVSHETIKPEQLSRIINALEKAEEFDVAQRLRDQIGEDTPTRNVYYDVVYSVKGNDYEGHEKRAAKILKTAGFMAIWKAAMLYFLHPIDFQRWKCSKLIIIAATLRLIMLY
jgi:hypothetical protein